MILIHGRAATYAELWFDEEAPRDIEADVLICRHRPQPVVGKPSFRFLTLKLDLRVPEENIFHQFGETNRYKIRRAENKDGVAFECFEKTEPYLNEFSDFFDRFASHKCLEPAYRRALGAASEAGQLVLTRALHAGSVLVWHAYIVARSTAVLLYSASHFRSMQNNERALVGRANRWLHWRDIVTFKQKGFAFFDWGGLFFDESIHEQAGINNFKCEFGGERVETYNCTYPLTLRGRAYLAARAIQDYVSERTPKRRA